MDIGETASASGAVSLERCTRRLQEGIGS
jgi:hypothetical protein